MADNVGYSTKLLINQIGALEVHDSLSLSQRFGITDATPNAVKFSLGRMRATMNQCTSRLRKQSTGNYRVESGTMLTDGQDAIIAVVVVTRLPGGGNEDDDLDI